MPPDPAATTWLQLRRLLRGRWFRRLLGVRLTSQLADGVFQVALASYVLFSPERQPTPAAIAGVLAVVLLPFTVLGPFAGVFLDRWSRRQVLAVANLGRAAAVAGLALLVTRDLPDPVFYAVVLACLSANRFVLAGLSASLPHTVERSDLVTANALTPTLGTVAALIGAGLGSLVRGLGDDPLVLATAACLYVAAAGLALRIPRRRLGPDLDPALPRAREAVQHVVSGLVDGLRHLRERRQPAYGLLTITAHRFGFGLMTVAGVLLHRNYFHDPDDPAAADAAFAGLALLIGASGLGFAAAAVVTPIVVNRFGTRPWIVVLLGLAAVVQVFPTLLFTEPALLVSGFLLGLSAQGIKICVDTVVQLGVDDVYRGRVFSIYDVLFNLAFLAAATTAIVVLPDDGRSTPTLVCVGVGYLLLGALVTRSAGRALVR